MARQTKTTTKPGAKADIDFEKELWDVANELRGAVAENQYKDYVLSLLFVKHLSERYEIRRQEIQLSFFEDPAHYGTPDLNASDHVQTQYLASPTKAEPYASDHVQTQYLASPTKAEPNASDHVQTQYLASPTKAEPNASDHVQTQYLASLSSADPSNADGKQEMQGAKEKTLSAKVETQGIASVQIKEISTDPILNELLEDELEYQVKNVYKLPREATWTYLRENAEQDDIKVKVDKAFVLIDEILAERNPDYKGVLEPIFVKSQLSPTQVSGLINLFSNEKFSEINNPESDIYGRVYEYYIGKFAMAEGSGAGQFFTPGSVVRLLVEMIEPLKGRIMDLACGSGGMFVQSLKFGLAHGGDKNDISIYGQERYEGTLRLCKMNLLLRNLSFDVKLGDSLLQDRFPNLKADYALMNPPFNISNWHPELLPDNDPRLFGPKDSFTTAGNANYMWFQTLWHHLSERGTAGVVMANGAMTTGSAGEKNVREYMIQHHMVDCIVQMPDKLFLTTGIPACIFILSRNRNGRDGEHRERQNEILFIDARKLGHMVNRRLRTFADADVARIADTYHQWRNLNGKYADTEGFCKAATLAEVAASNYVLSPGRYVGTEAEETDGIPFEEKMKTLTTELASQFAESALLEKKIRENLKGIGFEV